MWIPLEVKDRVLTHAPTRKSTACFWAVSLETGKVAYKLCETFDAKTFETFLKLLLCRRTHGKRMVIVLDNGRYPHSKLLAPLLFLPPYSPQLAPIERVWKLTRRLATLNQYFATLGDVLAVVERCFPRWLKPNAVLRRLCGIT
jgi:transposase